MTVDALHGTMRSLEREPVARVHRDVDGGGAKTANVVAFAAARQLRAMWIDMTCGAVACGGAADHNPGPPLPPPRARGAPAPRRWHPPPEAGRTSLGGAQC